MEAYTVLRRESVAASPVAGRSCVEDAWQKCRELGVDHQGGRCSVVLTAAQLAERCREQGKLLEVTRDFIGNLLPYFSELGFAALLTDFEAVVLSIWGAQAIRRKLAHDLSLVPGACLREEHVGNTAVGTALSTGNPAQLVGREHFCQVHNSWTGAAAPISNPQGDLVGSICVVGMAENAHAHTLGMVAATAKAIEGNLFTRQAAEELRLQHKYQEAIVESMSDGFLTLDKNGQITYMNKSGGEILGVSPEDAAGKYIADIVDFKPVVLDVLSTGQGYVDREFMVKTSGGFKHFIKTAVPIRDENGEISGVVDTFREIKRVRKMVNQMVGAQATFTFDDVLGESAPIVECLRMARLAAQSSSSVLIQGESGTGKELFAQSIHNDSIRRDGPFVAINCAALPRELIESELFGYEEGAFTGATKGGRPGKFELASGGTIFLDEIGDMPLDIQAKFLRVLEEQRGEIGRPTLHRL